MKRFSIFLMFLLLTFISFQQQAVAQSTYFVEGGVVAAGDNGQLYYFELQTGLSTRISGPGLEGVVIKPPFAVSEDGKVLLFMTPDGKFHRCLFTQSQPAVLKSRYGVNDFQLSDGHSFSGLENICEPYITDLQLSPDGTHFTFETKFQAGTRYQFVPSNSPLHQKWNSQMNTPGIGQEVAHLPMYSWSTPGGNFHGVAVTSISRDNRFQAMFRCGNSNEYPGAPRHRPSDFYVNQTPYKVSFRKALVIPMTSRVKQGMSWSVYDHCARYSRTRNAYHATWSKDGQMLAVIYKTTIIPPANSSGQLPQPITVWGPIEVRLFQEGTPGTQRVIPQKPCIYEIEARMPSCEGLAWMPDGSLTVRSDGSIYQISTDEITEGIDRGKITLAKHTREYTTFYRQDLGTQYIVSNNVFATKPIKLSHENVEGTRLCWVTDTEFIIRGVDGGLYLYTEGGVKKLLAQIPEDFFYCRFPRNHASNLIASYTRAITGPDLIKSYSGNDRVLTPIGYRNISGATEIGNFRIGWSPCGTNFNGDTVVKFSCKLVDKNSKLVIGVSVPAEMLDIDEIKDPSIFTYQEFSKIFTSYIDMRERFEKGGIIIFRHRCSYVAFQIVDYDKTGLSFRWKHWPEVKPTKGITNLTSAN